MKFVSAILAFVMFFVAFATAQRSNNPRKLKNP